VRDQVSHPYKTTGKIIVLHCVSALGIYQWTTVLLFPKLSFPSFGHLLMNLW
jgi:hypothetical protein